MIQIRSVLSQSFLRGLCWVKGHPVAFDPTQELYRTRIFAGMLHGMYFSMPRLERAAFVLGTYERHVVRMLGSHIKPGAVAYDVGANAGYLTLVMAKLVGSQGQVFSFEPDPRNLKALEENVKRNELSQVTAVAKAVSNESGTVNFASFGYTLVGHIARENTPDDAAFYPVAATSLDDFVFVEKRPKPDFIKIDVEGAEEQVFHGAKRVLAEVRPVVLAEVRSGAIWESVLKLMQASNYGFQHLAGGWKMGEDLLGDVLFEPLENGRL